MRRAMAHREGDVLCTLEAVQEDGMHHAARAEADDRLDKPAYLLGLVTEDEALNAIANVSDPELGDVGGGALVDEGAAEEAHRVFGGLNIGVEGRLDGDEGGAAEVGEGLVPGELAHGGR